MATAQTTQAIIKQIDRAIKAYEDYGGDRASESDEDRRERQSEVIAIVKATLERCAPANSPYRRSNLIAGLIGQLRALRRDYEDGYLSSVQGLLRSELFADFIEQAQHLLQQGYKDPAAVLLGSVLEEHLRALCAVRGISVLVSDKPKKADAMNGELCASGAYNLLDQKAVTAWLDLRNKAAHGRYLEYTREQVAIMLSGVTEFITRVPAN